LENEALHYAYSADAFCFEQKRKIQRAGRKARPFATSWYALTHDEVRLAEIASE